MNKKGEYKMTLQSIEKRLKALASLAPKRADGQGYLPTDEYYKQIMKWLSVGEPLYNIKGKDKNGKEVEVSRLKYDEESEFSIITKFYKETQMISLICNKNHLKIFVDKRPS